LTDLPSAQHATSTSRLSAKYLCPLISDHAVSEAVATAGTQRERQGRTSGGREADAFCIPSSGVTKQRAFLVGCDAVQETR
jgi:hypothetical protein